MIRSFRDSAYFQSRSVSFRECTRKNCKMMPPELLTKRLFQDMFFFLSANILDLLKIPPSHCSIGLTLGCCMWWAGGQCLFCDSGGCLSRWTGGNTNRTRGWDPTLDAWTWQKRLNTNAACHVDLEGKKGPSGWPLSRDKRVIYCLFPGWMGTNRFAWIIVGYFLWGVLYVGFLKKHRFQKCLFFFALSACHGILFHHGNLKVTPK